MVRRLVQVLVRAGVALGMAKLVLLTPTIQAATFQGGPAV